MSSVVERMTRKREMTVAVSVVKDVVDLEKAKEDLDDDHQDAKNLINAVVERRIEAARSVPVSIAAAILGLTPPTINKWADAGLLREARSSRKERHIDMASIVRVEPLISEIKALGKKRNLMSAVIARIGDDAMLRNPDLKTAIKQWEDGELEEITPED